MSVLLIFPLVYDIKFKGFFNVFITKISKWSYALYLVNYSIILLTFKDIIEVESQSVEIKTIILLLFWCISILVSALMYYVYEQPILKLRDSYFVSRFFK